MKNLKKLLSVILAAVMVLTTFSVAASALPAQYIDDALSHDAIDKPVLSLDQRSTMLLNYLDEFLAEESEDEPLIVEISNISLNLTDIDHALDSIISIVDNKAIFSSMMIGDLAGLNFDVIRNVRRRNATNTDTDILKAVVALIAQNAPLLGKVFDWNNLNLGTIGNTAIKLLDQEYLDIVEDIPGYLKNFLYNYIMGVKKKEPQLPTPAGMTLDKMVQMLVDKLLVGTLDEETGEYTGIMPGMKGYTDIENLPLYTIIRKAIEVGLNTFGKEALNDQAKRSLRKMCGVVYDKSIEGDTGDESNLNSFADVIDIHYEITDITLPTEQEYPNLFDDLNNLIGFYVNKMVKGNLWEAGDNSKILDNLATLSKAVLKALPDILGEDAQGFEFPTDEEIDAMGSMELFVQAAVISIDTFVDDVYIDPANCTTLRAFATYLLRHYVADYLPYKNYVTQEECDAHNALGGFEWVDGDSCIIIDPNEDDGWMQMAADLAIYFAKGYTTLFADVDVDQTISDYNFEDALIEAANWGRENYLKGMLDTEAAIEPGDNAFTMLDKLVLPIIPFDKLLNFDGFEDLIMDKFVRSIFDLDFDNLISLFERKTGDDALLAKPAVSALLEIATDFINGLFPGVIPELSTFDEVLTNETFRTVAVNLLQSIGGTKRDALMEGLIPIATLALDFEDPQELDDLEIDAPSAIVPDGSGAVSSQIVVTNKTSGLNTAATDIDGVQIEDQLFKYVIRSVSSNIGTVSVKYNGAAVTAGNPVVVNGGATAKFDITGTCNNDTPVTFTMTYDVTDEFGENLTSEPQVAVFYSYISKTATDATQFAPLDVSAKQLTLRSGLYRYMYTTNIGSIDNIAFQLQHKYNEKGSNNGDINITDVSVTGLPNGFIANPDAAITISAVDANNEKTYGIIEPIAKVDLEEGQTIEAPAYGTYDLTISFKANGTTFSAPVTVYYYNDFGLNSLVNACVEANRQPSDYTGGSASAEWQEYTAALTSAAGIVKIPNIHTTFAAKTAQMEAAADRLGEALANLQTVLASGGTAGLKALIDEYSGNKKDEDVPIAERSYFGREDYQLYTYERYKDYLDDADHVASKAKASSLDVAYATHELTLYYNRLIPRWTETLQLEKEVEIAEAKEYNEDVYTSVSWARYQEALDFSQNLINTFWAEETYMGMDSEGYPDFTIIRPSQVNAARHALINAQKLLAIDTGELADYTELNAAIAAATAIKDFTDYTEASILAFQAALEKAQKIEPGLTYDCQKDIDKAAEALVDAINGLKVRPADYTQLDAALTTAKTYNLDLYTEATAKALADAITAAEALDRKTLTYKDQTTVDDCVTAINDAISKLVEKSDEPEVPVVTWDESVVTVNEMNTITGLEEGVDTSTIENYISVENGSLGFDYSVNKYNQEYGEEILGTGTAINILDESGNTVDTYYIAIIGDFNGDGYADGNDAEGLLQVANYEVFDFYDYDCFQQAYDVNADWMCDGNDAELLLCVANYEGMIDQVNLNEVNPDHGHYFAWEEM